jgi:hypothetical protein
VTLDTREKSSVVSHNVPNLVSSRGAPLGAGPRGGAGGGRDEGGRDDGRGGDGGGWGAGGTGTTAVDVGLALVLDSVPAGSWGKGSTRGKIINVRAGGWEGGGITPDLGRIAMSAQFQNLSPKPKN